MNSAEKALELMEKVGKEVPIRRSLFGLKLWAHHWLWVSEKNGVVTVYLANGKNSHFPHFSGPCYCVDINSEGKKHGSVWRSAISMWPVRNKEEAEEIWHHVVWYIDKAYEQHCSRR